MSEGIESGPPGKKPTPVGNSGRKLPALRQSQNRRSLPSPRRQHASPDQGRHDIITNGLNHHNTDDRTDGDERGVSAVADGDEIIPNRDTTELPQSPGKASVAYITEKLICKLGKKDNISEITAINLTLARDHMNKKIKYIENLDKLKKLQTLNLSSNIIEKIERLEKLTQLRELNLSNNLLTKIEGLDTLTHLQVLNLSRNQIAHIPAGLFKKLRELRVIRLSHNQLETLVELTRLRPLPDLVELSVEGNPVTNLAHSRQFIIFQLRSLEVLDGKVITEEDREAADVRFGQEEIRRLHDELDRQQKKYHEIKGDNEKTLLEVQRLTNLHNEQKTKAERQVEKIKELKRELESNADLLKRKNAELSKACEKQFKLEQELAFYKLDAKFEHLGKMPFPDGAEYVEDGRNDESPYIGKAGFKPNDFVWDAFIRSPEQRAQVSPGGFYQSQRSDGRNRTSQQQPGEVAIIELQNKEQAIRLAEERLAALREEVFMMEQQQRDASDKLGRVQQAIKDQGKLLGDHENKLLDAIGAKMKYIRDLQKLAADLEEKMNQVGKDIRKKEDELKGLRNDLNSTPSDDRAYNELLDHVAAREQQLKDVMDEFDSLKNEYDKVIDMLRQEMADVKRLEDELAELQGKVKQDQDKLKEELKDLVEELTGQLDKMKEQANQQQQRISQLQQQKDALGRRVKELQQQIGPASELKDRIAKQQHQLEGTQEALDHERKERERLRQQLSQAGNNGERLKEAKERLHAAEDEADKLRKALDKLKKQQQADRQAADERIKKEQDRVERALQAARGLGDKEQQAKDLELQVDTLKAANATLADRLKDAEDELGRQMEESVDKDEVLRRLGDLKDDIDRGEVKVKPPVDEYDDLGRALASLQKRYNDITGALQRERQGSEKERKVSDSEIQALEERLFDAENALQRARDVATQLERANKAKDDDLKQMADELQRLKDRLSRQRSLEDELDKERSAHAMAMRELEAQLGQMKDQYKRKQAGLEEELANARAPLLEKIRSLEDALRQLQQKLNKAMREADRLKGEKEASESRRGELEDQMADLVKALREAEDRAGDAEARLGRDKRRLEDKIRDLQDELQLAEEQLRNLKEDAEMQLQRQQAKNDADLQGLEDELERMKEKMRNMQEKADREAARNQQREARKAQELEGELSALMNDLQKRVDELGRAQDEAAQLKNLLNDKESQLKAAAQRERAQQARLRGIEEHMGELRRMQEDVGAQTLQDKLEKELENVEAWQRRSAAEKAAARELARAQEQIAALQSLLRDKDRQLQDAMHRGSNNSAQLAAQRDELGNLAAALREQSAEIDRLKNMFGQQFTPPPAGLARSPGHDANLTALANEVDALRNALRDREQQVEELLQQNGFQWHPATVTSSNALGTGPRYIPVSSGPTVPKTASGVESVPASAAATPGLTAMPSSAGNGLFTTGNEIHHHHHLSKKSPLRRSTKKSVKIRDQDIALSPVSLASAAVTSSTPNQVHHHHYSVTPHGKERTRMKKEEDLFCNVPDHEDLEDEVEELKRLLEATSVGSHVKKNQRDRQSLRMELQDLEGEVEDALKRRSSIKRSQHQDLDATLAKFQDHLLTIMDHKTRLSKSH